MDKIAHDGWDSFNSDIDRLREFNRLQTPKPAKNSAAGKKRQHTGEIGEKKAREALLCLGYQRVRKNPPAKFLDGKGRMLAAKGGADFSAMVDDGSGRAVHAEVKTWNEDTLTWSALKPHQREDLDQVNRLGGVALLVWVRKKENGRYQTLVIPWPVAGFGPGRQSIQLGGVSQYEVAKSGRLAPVGQLGLPGVK